MGENDLRTLAVFKRIGPDDSGIYGISVIFFETEEALMKWKQGGLEETLLFSRFSIKKEEKFVFKSFKQIRKKFKKLFK